MHLNTEIPSVRFPPPDTALILQTHFKYNKRVCNTLNAYEDPTEFEGARNHKPAKQA